MISAEPAAVWYADTEYVYVGSQIDTCGNVKDLPIFLFNAMLEITPPPSNSDPVAASVKMSTSGNALEVPRESSTICQ